MSFFQNLHSKKYDSIISFESEDQSLSKVQKFYKVAPFPSYEKNESIGDILHKGNRNDLAKEVKEKFKFNMNILEAGSGTCQLASYLSIGTNNNVFALDGTLESLKEGEKFKIKSKIKNLNLVHGDILKNIFKDNIFDFVWCSGVLHHTKDAYAGFKNLCKCVKNNGFILIGLYNRYGRLRTLVRNFISKLLINKKIRINFLMFMDPVLRKLNRDKQKNKDKIDAWLRDQYFHPIETLHTVDQVLDWFNRNNIEFISSIPSLEYDEFEKKGLFETQHKGTFFDRLFVQIKMIFSSYGSEGGLFVIIGKKNGNN